MFREHRWGSKDFFKSAIEEWCEKNDLQPTSVLSDVSHLTDEDKQLVCDVYNNENSITTVQLIIDNLEEIKEFVKRGAREISLIAVPVGNIPPTFGYKM